MKTPEGKTKMDKQQVLNQLRNAKEIYVHKNAVCGMRQGDI